MSSATGLPLIFLLWAGPAGTAPPAVDTFPERAPALFAAVEVDGTGLEYGADVIVERVRARLESGLRQWDVRPARGASDPVLRFRLFHLPDGAGYRVVYEVTIGDEALPGLGGTSECRLCTEGEFIDRVDETVDVVVPALWDDFGVTACPPPSAAPAPMAPPTSSVADMVARHEVVPPPDTPLRAWGLGLTAFGSAAVGVGGGMLAGAFWPHSGLDAPSDPQRKPLWAIGTAVGSAGVVALATGITFLVRSRRSPGSGSRARRSTASRRYAHRRAGGDVGR